MDKFTHLKKYLDGFPKQLNTKYTEWPENGKKEKMRLEWNWMCRVFIAGTECGAAREAGKILMNLMSGAPEEEKDE